jgi:hypothetical protein
MRRLVTLFLALLVLAVGYGTYLSAHALTFNGQAISTAEFNQELSVITSTPNVACYITGLDPVRYAKGAGQGTVGATGVAAWATIRFEGIAVEQYVTKTWGFVPSAAQLAIARRAFARSLASEETANSLQCPSSPQRAIAAMTPAMRKAEVLAQADSTYLVKKLGSSLAITPASELAFYQAHAKDYRTLCVAVALVPESKIASFAADESSGMSVAALAKKYSVDASASKGGAYGCYGPSSQSYDAVRTDVSGLSVNSFGSSPQYSSYNGAIYGLFVALTSSSATPFAQAQARVANDMQLVNETKAGAKERNTLYAAAVSIDPAYGQWGLSTSGPSVFALATPPRDAVSDSSALVKSTK